MTTNADRLRALDETLQDAATIYRTLWRDHAYPTSTAYPQGYTRSDGPLGHFSQQVGFLMAYNPQDTPQDMRVGLRRLDGTEQWFKGMRAWTNALHAVEDDVRALNKALELKPAS